jgi:hypothetical protein
MLSFTSCTNTSTSAEDQFGFLFVAFSITDGLTDDKNVNTEIERAHALGKRKYVVKEAFL